MAHRNAFVARGVILVLVGMAANSAWGQQYIFRSIDVPAVSSTYVGANNNNGEVVGCYPISSLAGNDLGFALSRGVYSSVQYPGAISTCANGVSGNGKIVGYYEDSTLKSHGFLLVGKTYTTYDCPNTVCTGAVFTSLLDVNNAGVIVGYYYDGASYHGFRLQSGVFTLLNPPGSVASVADTINNTGLIDGYYSLTDPLLNSDFQGYLLTGGSYTPINYPGASSTAAIGLNNLGQIVGFYLDSSGAQHGFTDFSGVFATVDYPGAGDTLATEINDSGQIAGDWIGPQSGYDQHGFLATPIPGTSAGITRPLDSGKGRLPNKEPR